MNSLKIDFHQTPKSRWRIVVGILMILLSVTYFFTAVYTGDLFWFVFIYFFFFLIIGISHISEGNGHSINKLFGDAHLIINEEKYVIKVNTFKSGVESEWGSVESIKFGTSAFEFIRNDSEKSQLEYSRFSYQQVQDIKAVLNTIAEKHGIKINN